MILYDGYNMRDNRNLSLRQATTLNLLKKKKKDTAKCHSFENERGTLHLNVFCELKTK